jgi:peroxiredoxin
MMHPSVEAAQWAVISVVGLVELGLIGLVVQLARQNGRLLLKLDQLRADGGPAAAEVPRGLSVGTVVELPPLPDVDGAERSLAEFRGRRVLLVHWSPGCGFCSQIAPELAQLAPDLRRRKVELVLVSYGDADTNRSLAAEHGLECPILLTGEPPAAFAGLGTPVAYLLDEAGRVAQPLVVGAVEVPQLAAALATGDRPRLGTERSLAESRIVRTGLPAGTPAPAFELDDVRGGKISLEDYRGQRVLLVFSDPHCGPCEALAPRLAEFEREHGDQLAIVMISRGEPAENLDKVRGHDLEFPVVLQDGWKLSKQYGIFGTPVAFLIDASGTIEHEVAEGADAILFLAREAASREEAPLID